MAVLEQLLTRKPIRNVQKSTQIHRYETRAARGGIALGSKNHNSIAYRVPKEWASLPEELKEVKSYAGFKRQSKKLLLQQYSQFKCEKPNCQECKSKVGGEAASRSGQVESEVATPLS